jgi:hypothetical protein
VTEPVNAEGGREARHLKHLEMAQAIVARMAQNSFAVKGWAVTLCSALLALSAKDANGAFALLAVLPASVFWCLDAHYLSLERRYRALYERSASGLNPPMTLALDGAKQDGDTGTWTRAMCARVVWPIYVAILVLSALIAFRYFR